MNEEWRRNNQKLPEVTARERWLGACGGIVVGGLLGFGIGASGGEAVGAALAGAFLGLALGGLFPRGLFYLLASMFG